MDSELHYVPTNENKQNKSRNSKSIKGIVFAFI